MKTIIIFLSAILCATSLYAQNEVQCAFTSIDEDIEEYRLLERDILYRVEGPIRVLSGNTLEIEDGTTVLFKKASNSALIVEPGAKILIKGTSGNPVNFTSDQTPGNRSRGDFKGLYILGEAENNVSGGVITLSEGFSVSGGGTNDADSSGVIQYLNIMYSEYGLTGIGIGNKTVMDNIYVSESANKGIRLLGCDARIKYTILKNIAGVGYEFDLGDKSKMQYGIALTNDTSAHRGRPASYVSVSNQLANPTSTPVTHPVLSNFSLIGPRFCGYTTLHSDFDYGVAFINGAEVGMYNSVVVGNPTGLLLDGAEVLDNADLYNTLKFSYNSFSDNQVQYANTGTWPGSCAFDIEEWIEDGVPGCGQMSNQFQTPSYTLGYSSSYCNSTPDFLLGMNTLDVADFPLLSELDDNFFSSGIQKRGPLNISTDWTSWKIWNAQAFVVCPEERMAPTGIANVGNSKAQLSVYPNPTNGIAYVAFNTENAGKVTVDVVNSLGQVVRSINTNTAKGKQSIEVETGGLSAGVYMVTVTFENGLSAHAKVMVK